MKIFRTEVWGYAVLLIILFAIASLASWQVISYLSDKVDPDHYKIVITLILTLTLGFMMIAGAFGLWVIQFSAEAESQRRISRMVEAMYYLSDGLLSVDHKGKITGANPAAKNLIKMDIEPNELIQNILTCLSEQDISILLNAHSPTEVEGELMISGVSRVLRFRSQPSEGLILILISDVTALNARRIRNRQIAKLQLIGQIARGVAHDFNNILCAISGHASLLSYLPPNSHEIDKSVKIITKESERGISLASHLMELAQLDIMAGATDMMEEHVKISIEVLRNTLAVDWQLESHIESNLSRTALTGIQIEQIIINLSLIATDICRKPGRLTITINKPAQSSLLNVDKKFAAVMLISATTSQTDEDNNFDNVIQNNTDDESGVIHSILQSMIEEEGGVLETLHTIDKSQLIYRISLPYGKIDPDSKAEDFPEELKAYIANWSVLVASSNKDHVILGNRIKDLGVKVEYIDNIISTLAHIENNKRLDVIIIHKYLLGNESMGLLKAILKLQPSTGIVVLCDAPESEPVELLKDIIFLQSGTNLNNILTAIIEAKTLATRR